MTQRTRVLTMLLIVLVPAAGALGAATTFTFSTLAGTPGSVVNSADGTGSAAQFDAPRGVAVDTNGTVYAADYENHLIRKITSAGVVTALTGGDVEGNADGTAAEARPKGERRMD